ncbi:MAG: hypothetical protein E7202_06600 [Selenomonas ruminantium]|jgi:hypothetical protein|nr:hypothetical protein [Selenomonas ruminantium]
MKYLTKFNLSGQRIASYPLDNTITNERYAEMLNEGFIEIDESEWNYYVGNMGEGANGTGYIRDNVTGKPSSAPPYVPSKEEQLAALDAQYNADKTFLSQQYTDAMMIDDEELAAEIKTELVALNDKYDADYAAIEEGGE